MPIVHCVRRREADADAKFARRIFGDGECRRTRQRHLAQAPPVPISCCRRDAISAGSSPAWVKPRPRAASEPGPFIPLIADMRALRQQVRFVPVGELSEPVVVSSSSWDRCRSPREIVGPKVDCDGRQAQSDGDPENRRMMDRSSVARSRLHSITVRASSEGGTARPGAFGLEVDHHMYADC
ncbi:hypothetical protein SAMN05443248_1196 [Bradyrhizobium erythrophlei]|jgi:hypothetical protein|uniref:Uncharacterized protein n=1 Tax=Bradyrhizobium erythrophlei TaxID=1437360 RepID=A0A1M5J059_9BRAD|nr:hypothetical protein SAMN05443248_1196 [Bradyrhizobium erythrophlei]